MRAFYLPVSSVSSSSHEMTNHITGLKQIMCQKFKSSKLHLEIKKKPLRKDIKINSKGMLLTSLHRLAKLMFWYHTCIQFEIVRSVYIHVHDKFILIQYSVHDCRQHCHLYTLHVFTALILQYFWQTWRCLDMRSKHWLEYLIHLLNQN